MLGYFPIILEFILGESVDQSDNPTSRRNMNSRILLFCNFVFSLLKIAEDLRYLCVLICTASWLANEAIFLSCVWRPDTETCEQVVTYIVALCVCRVVAPLNFVINGYRWCFFCKSSQLLKFSE